MDGLTCREVSRINTTTIRLWLDVSSNREVRCAYGVDFGRGTVQEGTFCLYSLCYFGVQIENISNNGWTHCSVLYLAMKYLQSHHCIQIGSVIDITMIRLTIYQWKWISIWIPLCHVCLGVGFTHPEPESKVRIFLLVFLCRNFI